MTAGPSTRRPATWLGVVLLLIAAAYAAQVATPLRLNTDAAVFLGMAASHADGHGYTVAGATTHFPPGYPAIVNLLEQAGIARSSTLVGFNVACLLTAAAAGMWVLRQWLDLDVAAARLAAVLMLLGWGTIKHATLPVSESTFAAASTLALACWVAAEGSRRWGAVGWAVFGLVMTAAAISVRSIGVALVPAAGVSIAIVLVRWRTVMTAAQKSPAPPLAPGSAGGSLGSHSPGSPRTDDITNDQKEPSIGPQEAITYLAKSLRRHPNRAIVIGLLAIIGFTLFCGAVAHTRYAHEGIDIARQRGGTLGLAKFVLVQRFEELGSVALNLPSNGPTSLAKLNLLAGPIVLLVLVSTLIRRYRFWRGPDVYLAAYASILFVWPYERDVRFWVPVSMFLFGLILRAALDLRRQVAIGWPLKIAVGLWLLMFALFGGVALAFSTRISYAGRRFSEVYGGQADRATYRAASHSGLAINPSQVSVDQLRLLARYGKPVFDDGWLRTRGSMGRAIKVEPNSPDR